MRMSESARRAAEEEFNLRGVISSIESLFDVEASNPSTHPDNPFDFIGLLQQPEAFFREPIPAGKEVAVIGAGNAGVAAAYLLMRVGLKPVVYDVTGRVGGRSFTVPFSKDPEAQAELGSMRIPLAQKLVFYLLDRWGIKYKPFQNPLVVDTIVDVNGEQVFYDASVGKFTKGPQELIDAIGVVNVKYSAIIDPIVARWDATKNDWAKRLELWRQYVADYDNKSLFQVLIEHGWTPDQINLFGYIGIGSGGFDSFFPSSFLEIVRIEIQRLEAKGTQQIIIGGTNQIAQRFWTEKVECAHWGLTSLEELTGGLRPGVKSIRTGAPGGPRQPVSITDTRDATQEYEAVILSASPRAIDMTLSINKDAFSVDVWTALRNLEVTSSEKVFVLTETAFWNDPADLQFYTTLTDQPPRQMYTFDSSDWGTDTKRGVVCLSYSWASSSIRFNALNEKQRVEICLDAVENIYGEAMRAKLEEQYLDSVSICWEDQYGYSGGYRMANPGQAPEVKALHAQSLGQDDGFNNGLYLAGEALSWYGLSGWIDGAIKTGLQSAVSAILRVSGQL